MTETIGFSGMTLKEKIVFCVDHDCPRMASLLLTRLIDESPSALESTQLLESNALAEKEGFEPSFDAKRDGNSVGIPSEGRTHG